MDFKNEFSENGYVIISDFFNEDIIKDCHNTLIKNTDKVVNNLLRKAKINEIELTDFAIENKKLKYLKHANIYFPSINKLIMSKVFNFVESLIGDEVFLDAVEIHQKLPGASETPPHQDNFYFCLEKGFSLTAYIPLNKQSVENGGLAVSPGSHKKSYDHEPSSIAGFSSGIPNKLIEDLEFKNYELYPGDISFHHCNIIHSAPKNTSNYARHNIALRFRGVSDKVDNIKLRRYSEFKKNSSRIV